MALKLSLFQSSFTERYVRRRVNPSPTLQSKSDDSIDSGYDEDQTKSPPNLSVYEQVVQIVNQIVKK